MPQVLSSDSLFRTPRPQLSVHRVRLQSQDKKQAVPNDDKKTLASLSWLQDGDMLLYKDLGPQICTSFA